MLASFSTLWFCTHWWQNGQVWPSGSLFTYCYRAMVRWVYTKLSDSIRKLINWKFTKFVETLSGNWLVSNLHFLMSAQRATVWGTHVIVATIPVPGIATDLRSDLSKQWKIPLGPNNLVPGIKVLKMVARGCRMALQSLDYVTSCTSYRLYSIIKCLTVWEPERITGKRMTCNLLLRRFQH